MRDRLRETPEDPQPDCLLPSQMGRVKIRRSTSKDTSLNFLVLNEQVFSSKQFGKSAFDFWLTDIWFVSYADTIRPLALTRGLGVTVLEVSEGFFLLGSSLCKCPYRVYPFLEWCCQFGMVMVHSPVQLVRWASYGRNL